MADKDKAGPARGASAALKPRLPRGFVDRSAADIRATVLAAFPEAQIAYRIDAKRQGIVDSWPADVDDSAARADWGFSPAYDFDRAFREYLIPTIGRFYAS
jgi:hypothetical protein